MCRVNSQFTFSNYIQPSRKIDPKLQRLDVKDLKQILDFQIESKVQTKQIAKQEDVVKEKEYYNILKKRDDDRHYSQVDAEKRLKTEFKQANRVLIEMKTRKNDVIFQ
jgi:hypothetical protein